MKKYILYFCLLLIFNVAFAQTTAPNEYFVLVKKGDSLYSIKDYKNAAFTYSSAFKTFGWTGYVGDRYNAACCWAKIGEIDSAFFNLVRIVTKANYSDYWTLKLDYNLICLHDDTRWSKLLQMVLINKENGWEGLNKPLLYLLDSLDMENSKWRTYLRKYLNKQFTKDEDTISYSVAELKMVTVDSLNYYQVNDIFVKYGFPNYDIVGKMGSNTFWNLVQHQDNHPDFQDCVLEKLKVEADAGKASSVNYAYLVDRVNIHFGNLQVYGTQMILNSDSTSYMPKPMIDSIHVNERRKSVGMDSLEKYIVMMNNRYFGALKK